MVETALIVLASGQPDPSQNSLSDAFTGLPGIALIILLVFAWGGEAIHRHNLKRKRGR